MWERLPGCQVARQHNTMVTTTTTTTTTTTATTTTTTTTTAAAAAAAAATTTTVAAADTINIKKLHTRCVICIRHQCSVISQVFFFLSLRVCLSGNKIYQKVFIITSHLYFCGSLHSDSGKK